MSEEHQGWLPGQVVTQGLHSEVTHFWFNALLLQSAIFNNVFELTFSMWSLVGQWNMSVSRGDTCNLCVCWFCHSIRIFHLRCSRSTEFHDVPQFRETQSLLFVLTEQCTDNSRGHAFYFTRSLLRVQKEVNSVIGKTNDQGNLYSFSLMLLPCVSSSLTLKIMTWKEKVQPAIPVLFTPLLCISELKLESVDEMSMYNIKNWNKNNWVNFVLFHISGKNEIHMHIWA